MELHAVAHNHALDIVGYGPQDPFYGRLAELGDRAATDAHGVVVMLAGCGERVARRAVGHRQLAYNTGVLEQLQGPVHRCPAHIAQLGGDLLGRETARQGTDGAGNLPASLGNPVTEVLDRGEDLRRAVQNSCHLIAATFSH